MPHLRPTTRPYPHLPCMGEPSMVGISHLRASLIRLATKVGTGNRYFFVRINPAMLRSRRPRRPDPYRRTGSDGRN